MSQRSGSGSIHGNPLASIRPWLRLLKPAGLVVGPILYFGQLALAASGVSALGLPRLAWEGMAGAVFFASGFAIAWDLKKERDELKRRVDTTGKKAETRARLAELWSEGDQLARQCRNEREPPPNDEADDWARRAEEYLAAELGADYVATFRSADGLPMGFTTIQSMEHSRLDSGIRMRLARLQQFLDQLRTEEIRARV
jgi:hypothetical protein